MLLTLPTELLLSITEQVPPHDIPSLLRVNRRLHTQLTPFFYRLLATTLTPTIPSPTSHPDTSSTFLHLAAQRGATHALSRLLSSGGHIHLNAQDQWQHTPLIAAASLGHTRCVSLLLSHNADPSPRASGRCESALDFAAERGHASTLSTLLSHARVKALIDDVDFCGWTALHKAAFRGHRECVRLLVEAGADVDAAGGEDGRTALHRFARRQDESGVRLLLEAGANKRVRDADGATPWDVAAAEWRWYEVREAWQGRSRAMGVARKIMALLEVD